MTLVKFHANRLRFRALEVHCRRKTRLRCARARARARARRARAVVADEAAEALSPRRYALAGASALSLSLHMGALALGPYRPPAAARA